MSLHQKALRNLDLDELDLERCQKQQTFGMMDTYSVLKEVDFLMRKNTDWTPTSWSFYSKRASSLLNRSQLKKVGNVRSCKV